LEPRIQTFALETYARRSLNYLSQMVDSSAQPYFNVFWTDPAEAAHDWPDFGDVTSRQLQAVVMARHMTGEALPIERTWLKRVRSYLDPQIGLLVRPLTPYSEPIADLGDQALTLYALVTAYLDHHSDSLRRAIHKMVSTLLRMALQDSTGAKRFGGFMIKSLMVCGRLMDYDPALSLAGILVKQVFETDQVFSPDNTFRHGGHMHGNLRTLVGAADYALYLWDPILYSRVEAVYRYVRSVSTRFGFLPEAIGRQGDIVSCETCALMDYLGLAVTLANHGHPEYWGDAERVLRNQLVESQVRDVSWLTSDPMRGDTEQFTWRDVGSRMVGGWAGWSSPNHILAARETLNAHWGGPALRDKTRAFQNCCGGSGVHALFTAWKNASRFEGDTLSVHMHLDKLLPQAEIRGYQPYQGLTTIALTQPCRVRVRIPDFTSAPQMKVEGARGPVGTRVWGNYLELGEQPAGEVLHVTYPLPLCSEQISIGNPGFRQYHYRVTWKGDTVVRLDPLGNDSVMGYSDFDKADVPVFYGVPGPGPLYQRDDMPSNRAPELSPLQQDLGALDFWYLR
jgi:hypothetical protein